MANILIFGSSISYGAWDTEGGWVVRLRKEVDKNIMKNPKFPLVHDPLIYNLGVSGYSTKELVLHFEQEANARIHRKRIDLIIFEVGLNDSIVMKDKSNYVSKENFSKNIKTLIALAKKYTDNIIFLGLTPVDESKVNPVPWVPDRAYTNASIKSYNDILKQACKSEKVLFLDLLPDFAKNKPDDLLRDGVHPNDKGHQLLFNLVYNVLQEKNYL